MHIQETGKRHEQRLAHLLPFGGVAVLEQEAFGVRHDSTK